VKLHVREWSLVEISSLNDIRGIEEEKQICHENSFERNNETTNCEMSDWRTLSKDVKSREDAMSDSRV
jgi:hypothetical protein